MKDLIVLNQNSLENRILVYFATPYYHSNSEIIDQRVNITKEMIVKNINGDFYSDWSLFSPVLYTHPLIKEGLIMPSEGWYEYCLSYMINKETNKPRIDKLAICMIDGWENSIGVGIEKAVARTHGIEIEYIEPIRRST